MVYKVVSIFPIGIWKNQYGFVAGSYSHTKTGGIGYALTDSFPSFKECYDYVNKFGCYKIVVPKRYEKLLEKT